MFPGKHHLAGQLSCCSTCVQVEKGRCDLMGKDHVALALPHFWVSHLCWQLPFPCLQGAASGFLPPEVLLEMMHQRCVGAKCLISTPARWVGALCTQRRGYAKC